MNKAIELLEEALSLMDRGCTSWDEVYDLVESATHKLIKLAKEQQDGNTLRS